MPSWVTVFGRVRSHTPRPTQPEPAICGRLEWVPGESQGSKPGKYQACRVIHQPVFVVSQCSLIAWLNGLASGDQRRLTGSGSASEAMRYTNTPSLYCTLLLRRIYFIRTPTYWFDALHRKWLQRAYYRWRLLWRLIWLIQSLIYFSLRKAAKAAYYPTIFVCFLAELFYKSKPYEGYDEQRLNRQHGLQLRDDASFSLCIIPTARCQLKLSVILNYPYGICCCELIITFANADVMWSSRFVYYSVILSVCILTKKKLCINLHEFTWFF